MTRSFMHELSDIYNTQTSQSNNSTLNILNILTFMNMREIEASYMHNCAIISSNI